MVVKSKDVFEYPLMIRYRGTYDYDGLMDMLQSFYYRHKFDSFQAKKMKYKVGKTGAEVEFEYWGDRKITHYIKAELTLKGKMWDVQRREEVIDGKKKTVTDGKVQLKIEGQFILDYGKGFKEEKAFDKWMQEKLDADLTGLQFLDNKATGKKFMEGVLLSYAKEIKKFLGMDCY